MKELKNLKELVETIHNLYSSYEDIGLLIEMGYEDEDPEMVKELEEEIHTFEEVFEKLKIQTLLSGEYDSCNAIMTIHAGAGGTESCDWAGMLYRMYSRWAERKGFTLQVLDFLDGDIAGIKAVTFEVNGENAYGYLKSEKGVHRLVRISPFNAAGKRQTSFASCDVLPDLKDDIDIEIADDDLKIDTYRASGAGGQHVNKTSSAIRITHLPTGIVVQCQNERSQHHNKEKAMQMLKAKLQLMKEQEQAEKVSDIRGEVKDIGFGNQIRSYVMQPYTLVKDHRTNEENSNVNAVMDGDIDSFINAYLKKIANGTVGSGVVEVINTNGARINQRIGEELNIKYVLDMKDFPGDPVQDKIIHDFETIVSDEEVQIVVEVMGGIEPAYTFVKRCLQAGKSVATSNKALVAKHGAELLSIAAEHNINFLFEASVGGGIPIIRPLNSSLTADEIEEITGILNGTTNYMLSKMFYEGADYDTVLKEAQANGYAERNPEADVEGYDACRKIAILSSLISGQQVDFEDIYCEGITEITVEDMKYAKAMGTTIKLLASSRRYAGNRLHAIVAPCMLYPDHPLYNVNDVFNAIFVHGNVLGDAMFYGSGAGKLPTASAVVADVVDEAKHLNRNIMTMWKEEKLQLEDKADSKRRFFVRIKGDKEKLIPQLKESYGEIEVVNVPELEDEFGFVTPVMMEGDYETRSKLYKEQIVHMIRIQD